MRAKLLMDAILEECGAEVVDSKDPKVACAGWGDKIFHPSFLCKFLRFTRFSSRPCVGYIDKRHKESVVNTALQLFQDFYLRCTAVPLFGKNVFILYLREQASHITFPHF